MFSAIEAITRKAFHFVSCMLQQQQHPTSPLLVEMSKPAPGSSSRTLLVFQTMMCMRLLNLTIHDGIAL